MKARNIELHIEELVLHGFAPGDRHAIAAAVERELSTLLAQEFSGRLTPDSPARDIVRSSVDAEPFQVPPGAGANSIGTRIARAVHGGITK